MDKEDLMLIGLAAAGLYFMWKSTKANSSNTINNLGQAIKSVSEIFTGATGTQPASGWRFFTDGTSISPDGTYYQNGVKIWSPN